MENCRLKFLMLLFWSILWTARGNSADFRDVAAFGEGFVAVTDEGDVVYTDASGNRMKTVHVNGMAANAVAVHGNVVFVAGKNGRICSVSDGRVRQISDSGTDINALAIYGSRLVAACNKGKVVVVDLTGSGTGRTRVIDCGTLQDLIDITAGNNRFYALTGQGLILDSSDGREWSRYDFNRNYSDYYDQTTFTCICASDNSIYAAGIAENGYPRVYTSAGGSVWSQRGLSFRLDGIMQELDSVPLKLCYDAFADRFVMSCSDGVLFYMPGCTHCNSIEYRMAGDINSVALNGGNVLAAGDGDYLE